MLFNIIYWTIISYLILGFVCALFVIYACCTSPRMPEDYDMPIVKGINDK